MSIVLIKIIECDNGVIQFDFTDAICKLTPEQRQELYQLIFHLNGELYKTLEERGRWP